MNGPLDIHPKVAAGSAAAAAAFILEYLLAQLGIQLPTDVAAAIVVVLGFAGGWLAPSPNASGQSGSNVTVNQNFPHS